MEPEGSVGKNPSPILSHMNTIRILNAHDLRAMAYWQERRQAFLHGVAHGQMCYWSVLDKTAIWLSLKTIIQFLDQNSSNCTKLRFVSADFFYSSF